MLNCIILTILLLTILIINFVIYKKDIMEPAFIFNASFLISAFFLIFASNKWNRDISFTTVIVVVVSNILFSTVCYLIKKIFNKNRNDEDLTEKDINDKNELKDYKNKEIIIKNMYLIIFIIFSLTIIGLTIYFTVKSVGGDFNNIGAALYKFRNYTLRYKYDVGFPYIIDMLGGIVHATSYYCIYVFINNYIATKKINLLLLVTVLITTVSTVLDGTRGAIINIILSIIPLLFILTYNVKKKKIKINKKIVGIMAILATILLTQFQNTAVLLGRHDAEQFSGTDYINIYLGAPIYNLDTFINEGPLQEEYIGIHTFESIYGIFGNFTQVNNQSFREVDGNNIGNVYTILYDFICDGGYIGLIIGIMLMAGICQVLYEKIERIVKLEKATNKPNLLILIYCYIFGGIFFAFFGNKFFSQTFNLGFLKYVVLWYAYNFVLFRRKEKE